MKTFATMLVFVLAGFLAMAQSPQQMNYQGVARDNAGNILANQPVGLQLSILSGSITGTVEYTETQAPTTNAFGLFNIQVGSGLVGSGSFAGIDWASASHYLKVEMDASGGTSYQDMGTSQLLSVPYALFAETSGNGGTTGPQGPTGADGSNGSDGAVGATGPQGPSGADGIDGIDGADGTSVVIQGSVASSSNLPVSGNTSGDGYITQDTGHLWVWDGSNWVDAGLIQGPSGADGSNGSDGAVGATGPQGPSGADGSNGSEGAVGATGPQGPSGADGSNGSDGAVGATGPQGLSGADGSNGSDGAVGATGPQGPSGADGSNGSDGATGATGPTGAFTALEDADSDTKIQVEESADEDVIRFDMAGTEFFRMDSGRLEVLNTGNSVFIGENAGLVDDRTDNNNVFVGFKSGEANTSGSKNIALGAFTLRNNIGTGNTALGASSSALNTTGSSNVAVGKFALLDNETGHNNVAVGADALEYGGSADGNNVGLGFEAGYNTTGSGNVFVGHRAGKNMDGSNQLVIANNGGTSLIYGEFDNELIKINGQLSASEGFTDDDNDTKIQVEGGADEDIIRFDLAGTEQFTMDGPHLGVHGSGQSVFIGESAGTVDDLTDNDNTFVGFEVGSVNTSGYNNTAIGTRAYLNGNGSFNTAVGNWSLYSNTTGLKNTIVGSAAGQDILGSENTIIGALAGKGATGSKNVYIGNAAGFSATGDDKLYIENTNSNTPLIYGEFDNDLVKVNGSFEVVDNFAGAGQYVAIIENTGNGGYSNGLGIKAGQNTQSVNNRFISFVKPNGSEIGAVRQTSSSGVDYNTTSDERLKTNINPTTKGLSDLMQIEVKDYRYKDDLDKPQTGFIAQQVYDIYPNAVSAGGDDVKTDPWMMDYGKMTPLLVKAVQDQQALIEAMLIELEAQRLKIEALERQR